MTIPVDVKRLARWEIDLRREIRMDEESRIASRGRAGGSVRRVFSAKVQGGESKSVILYEI